jgi:isoleucyl-tRNA synthetase
LLSYEVSPNLKTLGPKLGERVREVRTALAALDPNSLAAKVQAGASIELDCAGTAVLLDAPDIILKAKAPDGWAGLIDHGTLLRLDTRMNRELVQEGRAREIVRHVQELRKKSGLEMEDRIALHFATESLELRQAVEAHTSYIAAETLAVEWPNAPLDGDSHAISVNVDRYPLTIQLRKVTAAGS